MNALFDVLLTVAMFGFAVAVVAITTRVSRYTASVLASFRERIRKEPENVRRADKGGGIWRSMMLTRGASANERIRMRAAAWSILRDSGEADTRRE